MSPEEIDGIIEAMVPVCLLCATMVDPAFDKTLCRDCWEHVKVHPDGVQSEITSANFAIVLGLTEGSKKLTGINIGSEEERLIWLRAGFNGVEEHTEARQKMLYSRFCALYLPALADELATSRRSTPFKRFKCFILMLARGRVQTPAFFAKFCLSDDPRAANGNTMASAIADQLLLHLPEWHPEGSSPHPFAKDFHPIYPTLIVLTTILMLQVDKADAVPIDENVREELTRTIARWLVEYPDIQQEIQSGLRTLLALWFRDEAVLGPSRQVRDRSEGLQQCARQGCNEKENLLLCSRCGTASYCSRKHQRDHWNVQPAGHKRVCYRTWF